MSSSITSSFRRLVLVLSVVLALLHPTASSPSQQNTIPRSSHRHDSDDSPPWNPSPLIDDDGFLQVTFRRCPGEWEAEANIGGKYGPKRFRDLTSLPVKIRQVPGDGNCLFHSIATCLSVAVNGTHVSSLPDLKWTSSQLRQKAVECLSTRRRVLFLQGQEYLRARDLVEAAACQYGLTGERYCELMKQDSYWGGGPEIVALCNVLRRPIHVYELHGNKKFHLRRMACFGSPKFDRREPLHILSADSRFPDVAPGKQLESGNHFLAMFPESPRKSRTATTTTRRRAVRGGGDVVGMKDYSSKEVAKIALEDRWNLLSVVSLCWGALRSLWTSRF